MQSAGKRLHSLCGSTCSHHGRRSRTWQVYSSKRDSCYKACQVAQSRPRLIPALLYVYPWLLRCLQRSPGLSCPSTTKSRPTKTPTMGGHNLTFPRGQSRCIDSAIESAWCGWAEAIYVYTTHGEKTCEYLRIKTACKWADQQTFKDQLHGLSPADPIVKRVYSVSNAVVNN